MADYTILTQKALADKINAIVANIYTPTNNIEEMTYSQVNTVKSNVSSSVIVTISKFTDSSNNKSDYTNNLLVLLASVSCEQAVYLLGYEYSVTLTASNIGAGDTTIPASATVKYRAVYSDGSTGSWTNYSNATATITGTSVSKNDTSSAKLHTVTASYYESDSVNGTATDSKTITQAARKVTKTETEYTISISASNVAATATKASYTVTAKKRTVTTYDTGTVVNGSWSNTTDYTVTGDTTFAANNTSTAKSYSVTATINGTSIKDTDTFTQAAATIEWKTETYCSGVNKRSREVQYINGSKTSTTRNNKLVESNSRDCGYKATYNGTATATEAASTSLTGPTNTYQYTATSSTYSSSLESNAVSLATIMANMKKEELELQGYTNVTVTIGTAGTPTCTTWIDYEAKDMNGQYIWSRGKAINSGTTCTIAVDPRGTWSVYGSGGTWECSCPFTVTY